MIPLAGGVASELLALLSSPVAQRRDDWFEDLQRRLLELEGQVEGFRFEDLGSNEQFVSAALQATQAALRTHRKEKLEALRNAVLNIAIGHSPDQDQAAMFLAYVEELSPWHLRLLVFFQEPARPAGQVNAGSIGQLLEQVIPDLRGKREFYSQITRDLRTRGLLNSDETMLYTTMTPSGVFATRTTEIANRFLKFIESPETRKE